MINLISTYDYNTDIASKTIWERINSSLSDDEGVCYYKDTLVTSNTDAPPDLIAYFRAHQPIIIRCISCQLYEIDEIFPDTWVTKGEEIDSPVLELEDFQIKLKSKFDQDRMLRQRIEPTSILALPFINRADFERKFGNILNAIPTIWEDRDDQVFKNIFEKPLNNLEWKTVRSIGQGIRPLLAGVSPKVAKNKQTLGEAIKELENQIALLDHEQERAAKQIAPGIQRIRGLAGTGKTVLLAMRAAEIHRRFPNKKILFTFNTQSLYNQARKLITKFYRFRGDEVPDWDMLHVRHAWGGKNRPGVYYELCERQGTIPLNLNDVRGKSKIPLQAICENALSRTILPEYDYILVDEAQDFPNDFFQILRRLAYPPYQICYAYDELQSLYSIDIPKPEDMFGLDEEGKPYIVFDGEDYPGGIDKEYVLHRSYRCPQPVLMLAHAIGLGLYSSTGCVQMLEKEESWQSIGYEIRAGKLEQGQKVEIYRSPDNSPNSIAEIYDGEQKLIVTKQFSTREDELDWVADSVATDIRDQKVNPDQIIVISLEARLSREYLATLQVKLVERGVPSTIPGIVDDTAAFMEPGKVTLTTINRAKGNEAPIVYIISFESLYDYLSSVENRNRAFTSISRSKAWVRITGVGRKMQQAEDEITKVRTDYPWFKFVFPDMDAIRRLDAITVKRKKQVDRGKSFATDLLKLDREALEAIAKSNPALVQELLNRLQEASSEDK